MPTARRSRWASSRISHRREPLVLKGLRLIIEDRGHRSLASRMRSGAVSPVIMMRRRAESLTDVPDHHVIGDEDVGSQLAAVQDTDRFQFVRAVSTCLHRPVEPAERRAAIAANVTKQATGDCQGRIVVAARTRDRSWRVNCRAALPLRVMHAESFVSPERKSNAPSATQ